MSEFELRRALRALDTSRDPAQDLWPGIAARIAGAADAASPVPVSPGRVARRRWPMLLALAASLTLAVLVTVPMLPREAALETDTDVAVGDGPASREPASRPDALLVMADAMALEYRLAIDSFGAHPMPPEVAPALAELDGSASRIRAALREDPQAEFLVGQLRRTYAQRLRLTQQALAG